MPSRALRPCSAPGCHRLTSSGRCDTCRDEPHEEARGNSNSRGYTKRWRLYALAFLAEHPLCYYCALQGITTPSTCVDHATPPSRGGEFWDEANHRASCKHDNDAKGDKTEAEYVRTLRLPIV